MTQREAVAQADRARLHLAYAAGYRYLDAGQKIIELVAGQPVLLDQLPPPGPVYDRIAWLVTFIENPWTLEIAVDDATGRILRVQRSRGGPDCAPEAL